jgi:SAM-dependent methyltransferase
LTLQTIARRVLDEILPCDGTSGIVSLFRLRVLGPNRSHGVRYQASDAPLFRECFALLQEDWRNFTFVDLGCGKGRPLLLARELGFGRIIGVEFAPALATTARRNAPFAEVVLCDASEYLFPRGPLVVFLYNPFDDVVLRRVVPHLPECYVVYLNPRHDDVFANSQFTLLHRHPHFSVWRGNGLASANSPRPAIVEKMHHAI